MKKKYFFLGFCLILLIAGIVVLKLWPRNQRLYKVTILPTLGGKFTFPRSINDKGQVAGYSEIAPGEYHLFLWDNENGINDLGPCEGFVSLNNAGQIATQFWDPNGNSHAFIWDPNTGKTVLPTLGGKNSIAFDINNHGQIVGYSDTSSGVQHAFIWNNTNGICDLTPNSMSNTLARSINDAGQVIICQDTDILVNIKGNIIVSSLSIPLSNMINNYGFIIGTFKKNQNTFDLAIWHPATKQTRIVKTLSEMHICKMNDLNQIIITEVFRYKALFKRNKTYIKTKNYLHDPKLGLLSLDGYIKIKKDEEFALNDINNNGWIIGTFGSEKDSNYKGVLFEPIPEKMKQMLNKTNKSR